MIIVEPGNLRDLADIGPLPRPQWQAIVVQITRSCTITLRDYESEKVLAIAGLYEHDDHGECWIHFSPGLASHPLAGNVVRRLLTLARGLCRITVIVKADCAAGLRIARLAKFRELDRPFEGYIRFIR